MYIWVYIVRDALNPLRMHLLADVPRILSLDYMKRPPPLICIYQGCKFSDFV